MKLGRILDDYYQIDNSLKANRKGYARCRLRLTYPFEDLSTVIEPRAEKLLVW